MPVRTAYVGTQVAGDVLTAANFSKLPGGWIGHAEVTADQAAITTLADLTGLTVTVTAGTSRRIRISGRIRSSNTGANTNSVYIREGATVLGTAGYIAATSTEFLTVEAIVTPTPGAHTYKLSADTGGGTMTMRASSTAPAFILVEDLGPAA